MFVRDLMSQPPVTCHVNDPLNVAAQLMWDHDCGFLPVVNDEGVLTGVITDRDICMAAYTQARPLDAILVNGAMAKHVVSVQLDQSIETAEQLMSHNQIRRVPVIDAAGQPVGVLSLNDIARESAQPDSKIKYGLQKVAHTLAAICRPHPTTERAA